MAGPYQLFLVRHGIAEDRGEAWPDDAKRPLTNEGMSRLRKIARSLVRLGVEFDIVLTSPLTRSRQTADILADAFDPRPTIANFETLAPGGAAAEVIADLEKHARRSRIALVGHEPGIGELAARLLGSRHAVTFKKGGVCRIDIDTLPPAGPGDLRWFVTPKILLNMKR